MKAVSIIVPVYNTEKYLYKCLDSLVNQTLTDIEIIVINDGSPDNSQKIIDDFSSRYPTLLKGYIKPNGGLGDARNYGLQFVNGEYIGFIDSDDYAHPDMYRYLYTKAKSENADMAICEFSVVDEDGKTLSYTDIVHHSDIDRGSKFFAFKYGRNEAFNKLYKSTLFLDSDIRYPRIWFEDYPTTPLLIEKSNKVVYVEEFLYYYVQRAGSIMNQAKTFSKRNFEILDATELIIKSKDIFVPEHYRFYIQNVVPVHAFIKFYRNILLIQDKVERNNIIKQWGSRLNYLLPEWWKSPPIQNLANRISNPLKKFIFKIIVDSFQTGNTSNLNKILFFRFLIK